MTLKTLGNYVRYSGIWVNFALNPFHWRFSFEFMQPDEINPAMRGFFVSVAPVSIRLVIDDGSW